MPLGYHINDDDGLITVQGAGDVTVHQIARLGEALLRDQRYDPSLPQLLDFRGLRPVDIDSAVSEQEVAELWAFIRDEYRGRVAGNVAVVIDDHLETRHCADIFLLTCAIHDAELFADYDQALKWLMRRAFAAGRAAASGEQQDAGSDEADGAPE